MVQYARVTGDQVLDAFRLAEGWLAANREGINAINVYPVPDGDTGTNMLLTWRAALQAAPDDAPHAGDLLAACSRAALLGARGNSGVILSQMIRGLAEASAGQPDLDAAGIVAGLLGASQTAYDAVSAPVEGTMLTVLRDAAQAAEASLREGHGIRSVFEAAVIEAFASVERTPALLPRLREAGVVDSGGLGVAIILEGMARGLAGEPLPEVIRAISGAAVDLGGVEHEGHGYCTEFIIFGASIDRRALQDELATLGGDSILVVGDPATVHVHVHMEDPGPALSAGVRHGALSAVKIENMQAQHEEWARGRDEPQDAHLPPLGLVAVAPGEGFARLLGEMGAVCIGQDADAKASAGEFVRAARRAGREHVFLLPNDKDTLMAAEQAAREAPGFITVLPSISAAAGMAAAIAYWPDGDRAEVAARMTEAMAAVRTVEVSRSVRDATVDGIRVSQGDAIALLDGRLVARAQELEGALLAGLGQAARPGAEIVTVYLGAEAPEDAAVRIAEQIRAAHPGVEVEVVQGGQPHYPYVLGVE
ncbi:MAG: DAK2 domain-containing protein [Chloroflexi bacterium]|nr:DAK2 domain-containing protein [Chloroflexota bacterium]MDA1240961.1 DAK2 domain-containing protein [Chloroflexota bacterium]